MAKRILIINPFGIGDVLFSTPLVSALKEMFPSSNIGYICNSRTEEIIETNPDIGEVFVFERDDYRRLWESSKTECIKKVYRFWRRLSKGKFDIAIDLSLGREYAFLCWLIGIKERRGFNYKGRGRFLTHKIQFDGFNDQPIAEYYLNVVGLRPRSSKTILLPTYGDETYIDNFIRDSGIREGDLLIGIAPGGGAAFGKVKADYKRWATENFAELTEKLAGQGATPVLLWGPGEKDLVTSIQDRVSRKILVAPRTTVREMAVLMKKCKLVVCNDGGMLHVAVSQDVATISIFGPTDEDVYGPYPPSEKHIIIKSDADCRPCYRRFKLPECNTKKCMKDISVDEVFNIVKDRM